jgi:HK97 family phage major capsid protein
MNNRDKFHTLAREWEQIEARADREKRGLTEAELGRTRAIDREMASLTRQIAEQQSVPPEAINPQGVIRDYPGAYPAHMVESAKAAAPVISPGFANGSRYQDLFPDVRTTLDEWRSVGEYVQAVGIHNTDPRLSRRGYVEGVPSDGGFAVPTEMEQQVFDIALEGEIVRPRARNVAMMTNERIIPAVEIGDHSQNLYGGVTTYWKSEAAELEESKAELRQMTLTANKLTALAYASAEWLEDAVEGEALVQRTFAGALGFELDYQFLRGPGAGKPLGIENSPCLIEQAKESGQSASTIVADNLFKMLSRLHAASFGNAVWVAHPGTLPKLAQISVAVGTGGGLHPGALTSFNGRYNLLGKPLYFSEKMASLGSKFDILLADFSQYVVGIRQGLRFDASGHVKFTSDQITFRMLARVDGQPMWDEALTLKDGSTTVSPFVTLAERSA